MDDLTYYRDFASAFLTRENILDYDNRKAILDKLMELVADDIAYWMSIDMYTALDRLVPGWDKNRD